MRGLQKDPTAEVRLKRTAILRTAIRAPLAPLALAGTLALAAPLAFAPPAAAQQIERERQEVLLPTVGVLEITPDLRGRLGLFPEIQGFRSARLFLRGDGSPVLEIEFVQGGVLQRERRFLSAAELNALRGELGARMEDPSARMVATREGRGGLVLTHTLMGLGFYGWAVPLALDVSSGQAVLGSYLLTAGASFYLPYSLTQDRTVTQVHRSASLYGGSRGIISGLFLGDLMNSNNTRFPERARFGTAVMTGALGGAAGFMAIDPALHSMGDAQLWQAAGDAGILSGAAVAYLAGPYGREYVTFQGEGFSWQEERRKNRRAGHAITLAGQGLGLFAGTRFAARRDYTAGDVSVLRSVAVLGAQTGSALVRIAGGDEGEPTVAGALAGGLLGIYGSDRFFGELGLGTGEELLVNAGHIAGAASALGITYLLTSELEDRNALYMTTAEVGGWIGAGIVLRAVSGDTRLRTGMIPGVGLLGGGMQPRAGAGLTLDPAALILSSLGSGAPRDGARAGSEAEDRLRPAPLPWFTLRF